MSDKSVTVWNPQLVAELSEEYKTWAFGDSGECFIPAMEEVQRLCEVIVGIRADLSDLREVADNARAAIVEVFGADAPLWSPADAIRSLGRVRAVVQKLGELFGGEFVKYLERQVATAQPSGEGAKP